MSLNQGIAALVARQLGEAVASLTEAHGEVTVEVGVDAVSGVLRKLRDEPALRFEQLIDLCGVDYLLYGAEDGAPAPQPERRFAVVYHLLSVNHNQRLRVRVWAAGDPPIVPSATGIWTSANWFEREAFDLFGIVFDGHPDLRRILTDYGFIGHPFRKDFPLTGRVEMRYDPERQRVVYEPVSIEPRVLVPRVIREEGYGGRDT